MSLHVLLSATAVQRGRSGVASYVFGLLEGLRSSAPELRVSILGLAGDKPLFERWLDRFGWVEVPEFWRPAVRNVLWHQTRLRSVLRASGADVLHVPTYRRLVWRSPIPQVATIHDCAAFEIRGKYDAARTAYARHVSTRLGRAADRVVTVSHHAAKDIARHFRIPASEITVVHNGINHGRFNRAPLPADAATRASLGAHGPYFLYIARLEHPGKNHVALIQAFEEFRSANPDARHRLVLAGADWHGAEQIHARVESSPFREAIVRTGFIQDDAVPALYRGATALAFPSLFEGFGLPVAEAMACGCRVIASDRGSLPEVAGDAAVLLAPDDIAGWTRELAKAAAAPCPADLDERMRAQAARFDWNLAARATLAVYEQAAAARRRA